MEGAETGGRRGTSKGSGQYYKCGNAAEPLAAVLALYWREGREGWHRGSRFHLRGEN